MKAKMIASILLMALSQGCLAAEGVISIESAHSVGETMDRLETILAEKGFKILNRINHGAAAKKTGVDLRQTELIIFGNPKVGSPLMACQQSVAIDLPQKALATRDDEGKVWLSYNNPAYLKHRHGIEGCDALLEKVASTLSNITKSAAD
jgi:uncharacterized protein (DUF302 family)